jgi:acetyl esterase/lipase
MHKDMNEVSRLIKANDHLRFTSIHHPLTSTPPDLSVPHVAIYLPRGPIAHDPSLDAQNIADLRAILPCPIVQVNYRCRHRGVADHAFPTPLHDTVTGYDWVLENLLAKRAISRPGRSDLVGRIAVVGELLGGSLATSLALTECRIGEPGIVAAAVSSPIVDWIAFDNEDIHDHHVDGSLNQSQQAELTPRALLDHRRTIFRRPDAYFDPFASPVLFFRSAGADVPAALIEDPRGYEGMSDMDLLAQLCREEGEEQDYFRAQLAMRTAALAQVSHQKASPRSSEEIFGEILYPTVKKRKASRRYPSPALKLRLPPFHITTGGRGSILNAQNAEFARLLRKSDERQQRGKNDDYDGFHEQLSAPIDNGKVELTQSRAGLGLWDAGQDGRASFFEAAQWLRTTLFHGD